MKVLRVPDGKGLLGPMFEPSKGEAGASPLLTT